MGGTGPSSMILLSENDFELVPPFYSRMHVGHKRGVDRNLSSFCAIVLLNWFDSAMRVCLRKTSRSCSISAHRVSCRFFQ